MTNVIKCDTMEDFATLCGMFQSQGLKFKGYSENLTIEIIGH